MISRRDLFPLSALGLRAAAAAGQRRPEPADQDFRVYTEHPRIFLRAARLRLLKRERERQSLRWTQFEALISGGARMPQPGFAQALYYRVSGDEAAARRAVQWASQASGDLRQTALVFDWCQEVLSPRESGALAGRLAAGIEQSGADPSVGAARSRMLAAVALAGHSDQTSSREIAVLVKAWWGKRVAPGLREGRPVATRDDAYALFEFLHAVRDSLQTDLREDATAYFKDLPYSHLLSHYPARYPASENEYRIPAAKGLSEPDLDRAALSRAAELSMVAFDANAPESQVMQGWLMHDQFILRGPFGIPYELLWANPYQPGLSYYHVPLMFHDPVRGQLYARSSWEEDALWIGYADGELQVFRDGRPAIVPTGRGAGEVLLAGDATVIAAGAGSKYRIPARESEHVFVAGLEPDQAYALEIDDEELSEVRTDRGGILAFTVRPDVAVSFRIAAPGPAKP
jgi:hypothetical protein